MASFPSFQKIVKETGNTFIRFPLEILIAITGTICAIYLNNETNSHRHEILINALLKIK